MADTGSVLFREIFVVYLVEDRRNKSEILKDDNEIFQMRQLWAYSLGIATQGAEDSSGAGNLVKSRWEPTIGSCNEFDHFRISATPRTTFSQPTETDLVIGRCSTVVRNAIGILC